MFVKQALKAIRNKVRAYFQRKRLRSLPEGVPRRIVIGSSGTCFRGWIATDREVLDLLDDRTWKAFFSPNSLDALLAEHVWEHLSPEEAKTAARTCFAFLRPGGHLRIAVPDGFHPDPGYLDAVKPGGTGPGSEDHKVLYNVYSLRDVLMHCGFEVRLLEYFDDQGQFHYDDWDPSQGLIRRSRRFDARNSGNSLRYTSLIVDAFKP